MSTQKQLPSYWMEYMSRKVSSELQPLSPSRTTFSSILDCLIFFMAILNFFLKKISYPGKFSEEISEPIWFINMMKHLCPLTVPFYVLPMVMDQNQSPDPLLHVQLCLIWISSKLHRQIYADIFERALCSLQILFSTMLYT